MIQALHHHHILFGLHFMSPWWTLPQRVTVILASILTTFALTCLLWAPASRKGSDEPLLPGIVGSTISAIITFLLTQPLSFFFAHTPHKEPKPTYAEPPTKPDELHDGGLLWESVRIPATPKKPPKKRKKSDPSIPLIHASEADPKVPVQRRHRTVEARPQRPLLELPSLDEIAVPMPQIAYDSTHGRPVTALRASAVQLPSEDDDQRVWLPGQGVRSMAEITSPSGGKHRAGKSKLYPAPGLRDREAYTVTLKRQFPQTSLVATAKQETIQGNFLVAMHLVLTAGLREVKQEEAELGEGSTEEGNTEEEKEAAVEVPQPDGKAAVPKAGTVAAARRVVSGWVRKPDQFGELLRSVEEGHAAWLEALDMVKERQLLSALECFQEAMLEMSPNMEMLLEGPYDFVPWVVYYGHGKMPRTLLDRFILAMRVEEASARQRAEQLGNSQRAKTPKRPKTSNSELTWKRGIKAVKEDRHYILAAHIFMAVRNLDLDPGAEKKTLAFGYQWVEYYATKVAPIDNDFEENYKEQGRDPHAMDFLDLPPWNNTEMAAQTDASSSSQPPRPSAQSKSHNPNPLPDEAVVLMPMALALPLPPLFEEPPSDEDEKAPFVARWKTTARRKRERVPKESQTLYVDANADPDGPLLLRKGSPANPFTCLTEALDRCRAPRSNILLADGEYTGPFVEHPPYGLTIRATGNGAVIKAKKDTAVAMTLVGALDCKIEGITFVGDVCIEATECFGLTLKSNTFKAGSVPFRDTTHTAGKGVQYIEATNTIVHTSYRQWFAEAELSVGWAIVGHLFNWLWLGVCTCALLMVGTNMFSFQIGHQWTTLRRDAWLFTALGSLALNWFGLDVAKCAIHLVTTHARH